MKPEPAFTAQVRCTSCKEERRADGRLCPHCGAKPYPHRTDREEWEELQRMRQERGR